MKYDYLEALRKDIRDYIKENDIDVNDFDEDTLYNELFLADSVTGNSSGSYWCNSYKARECVLDNYEALEGTINEYMIDMNEHYNDWEYLDVCIRCCYLWLTLNEVLEELKD